MTRSANNLQRFAALTVVLPLAAALTAAAVGTCLADDTQAPAGAAVAQQPAAAAPGPSALPAQPPPANRPGFIHQLGVWWDDGFGDFNAKMKAAKDKLDDY